MFSGGGAWNSYRNSSTFLCPGESTNGTRSGDAIHVSSHTGHGKTLPKHPRPNMLPSEVNGSEAVGENR